MAVKGGQYKSYIFTGLKDTCTGCGACVKSCTHSALRMSPDNEGFLYPQLDKDKCIHCGLCDIVCPVVGRKQGNIEDIQHCFIATSNKKEYYIESATIGICTMLAEHVLKLGGYVYGCYLDENNWTAYHVRIDKLSDVGLIRNSKYLQSNLKDTFESVKNDLLASSSVLYFGTPCQIAGLKAYLHKDYDNLVTVDIICHGTFSPSLLPLEVNYWEQLFNSKISNFRFRSKKRFKHTNCGMVNFDIISKSGRVRHIERHASASPSYYCFAYAADGINYNLRLSCYKCPMRDRKRYGDITVGDPWKVDNTIRNSLNGNFLIQSVYSANTAKGMSLLELINSELIVLEKPREVLFCQDAVLPTNRQVPSKRSQIYDSLSKVEYGQLIENIFDTNLEINHKKFVMDYIKGRLKDFVKIILHIFNSF